MRPFLQFLLTMLLGFCITIETSYAQKNIKDYVMNNTISFKTVSPDSTNYADIEPIANAIGDASVVMLGEEDHGDAPAFQFKTRLIKYLHEKKGFNVLAFESDFLGLNYGWDRLPKERVRIDSFVKKNVFGIWTVCDACNTLFYNYIPQSYATSTPLVVSGFDSQQYLDFSYHNLMHLLDSVLRSHNLAVTQQANYPAMMLMSDSSKRWIFKTPRDTSRVAEYFNTLLAMRQQLTAAAGPDDFWVKVIDGQIAEVKTFRYKQLTGNMLNYYRDIQMAQNLEWLIKNKFKGQKIIVWAADYHLGRIAGNFKWGNNDLEENMGSRFSRDGDAGQGVYVLGVTSFQGQAGRIGFPQYALHSPRSNSFERWMNKNYSYAFTDFKKYNADNPYADEFFWMAGFGHMDTEAKWNHVFDGVVFIRDMYACQRKEP